MIRNLVVKHSLAVVFMSFVLTILGGYFSSQLRLESDLAELLPEHFDSVKTLNRIKDEIGGVSNLRIILECEDYPTLEKLSKLLADSLSQLPMVSYVDFKNDVAFYKKNGLLLLGQEELDSLYSAIQKKVEDEKQKLNPLFVDDLFADGEEESDVLGDWESKYRNWEMSEYFTNADSSLFVLKIYPHGSSTSLAFIRQMLASVQAVVERLGIAKHTPAVNVYYGGNIRNKIDEYEIILNDILGTAVYGLGGVFLLIVVYFRRFFGAFLITLALLCSLSWTFGVTYIVLGQLNTITGFLFVILFGLGIDYGIHAFARYTECRKDGLEVEPAIEKMVSQTGRALATTAATTAAAFFSLTLLDFRGFSELGFISGVGILFALLAMTVVLPALIVVAERFGRLKIPGERKNNIGSESRVFPLSKTIIAFSAITCMISLFVLRFVSFEYDFTNLRAITKEREQFNEKTQGVFKLSESPAVVLADDKEDIREIVAAIESKMASDSVSPTIDAVRSVYSLVPDDQEQKLAKIKEIRQYIDKEADGVLTGDDLDRLNEFRQYLRVDKPFTWDDFPEKDKRQFINKKGEIGNFVFIYPAVALRDGRNAIDFRNDIGTIVTASGKTYHASSSNIIMADMLIVLISEGRWAVILTFLVVFIIVLMDTRNLRATLLILSPLVVGIIWIVGVMFMLKLKWNLFNIVVIPSVIGIGVDHGVHIYHRYVEEGVGSLLHVLKNTGAAVSMTTLTTLVGYSGLVFAHHPGLNSIGKLALIGISLTFLTAVIVLPAILQHIENRTQARA